MNLKFKIPMMSGDEHKNKKMERMEANIANRKCTSLKFPMPRQNNTKFRSCIQNDTGRIDFIFVGYNASII